MTSLMIISRNVTKYFGKVLALKDVSFEIGKGEIVGFLGKNGAGKTTLMRILTSYLPPSSGNVSILNQDIARDPVAIRRHIGYLPETPPLYPNMTVRDYLKFAAQLKDVPVKQLRGRVDKVLDDCRLLYVQDKLIAHLSKGYQQRIGIAQAIIHEPQLLILDEPTSGLDPAQIQQVRKLIKDIEHQRTVLLSTHILSEIEQIAKRVLIINSGEIIRDESLESLLKTEGHGRRMMIRFQGDRRSVEDILIHRKNWKWCDGESSGGVHVLELETDGEQAQQAGRTIDTNDLISLFLGIPVQILEIKELKPSLEEVFLKLNPPLESQRRDY